jgi:hypothetical protein
MSWCWSHSLRTGRLVEGRLTSLVLNGVTPRLRSRAAAVLRQPPRPFSKGLVQEYRTWLDEPKAVARDREPAALRRFASLAQEMATTG